MCYIRTRRRTKNTVTFYFNKNAVIQAARHTSRSQTLLLFAGEDSAEELDGLLATIRGLNTSCFGAIFPEIMSGRETSSSGYVISHLDCIAPPILIKSIDERNVRFESIFAAQQQQQGTVLIFADADCGELTYFLNRLHHTFGNGWQYLGAGAGSYERGCLPCVFTAEEGLQENAVVLGAVGGDCCVNARHGWKRSVGPFVATKTEKNIVHELNWEPDFDVYRRLITELSGRVISSDDLRDVGIAYPFGIIKEGTEELIRLPIAVTPEGGLVVIGGVPPNAVLHISAGKPRDLISAASAAAESCSRQLGTTAQHKFVFDCMSRRQFLGAEFAKELAALEFGLSNLGDVDLIGAMARGEIASVGGGFPEWLNNTTVVGAFA